MVKQKVKSEIKSVATLDSLIAKHDALEAEVKATWTKEGLERDNTAYYVNIDRFLKNVWRSKAEVVTSVDQVVRVVSAKGEYLFFDITQTSEDALGTTIQCNRRIGTVDEPIFKRIYQINPENGEKLLKEIAITNQVPKYCLEFTKENLEILRPFIIDYCSFILKIGGPSTKKYGGFSFDEFSSQSAEELEDQGRYGRLAQRRKIAEMKAQREAIQSGSE